MDLEKQKILWRLKYLRRTPAQKKKYRIKQIEWEQKNKERISLASRRRVAVWKTANPENIRVQLQNRRARGFGKLSNDIQAKLRKAQRGRCAACGSKPKAFHLDHIIPLALGGRNENSNIQLLCADCNLSKGRKHPVEFMQSIGKLL